MRRCLRFSESKSNQEKPAEYLDVKEILNTDEIDNDEIVKLKEKNISIRGRNYHVTKVVSNSKLRLSTVVDDDAFYTGFPSYKDLF